MNDEEVTRLTDDLRSMLEETGFGWLAAQAGAALPRGATDREIARALIDAAEAATVDLAHAELISIRTLQVDQIVYNPDPDAEGYREDRSEFRQAKESSAVDDNDRARGQLRLATLERMTEYTDSFVSLRAELDDLV